MRQQGPAAVTIGSTAFQDAAFPMAITLDPRGAGLGKVVLNDYFETAKQEQQYTFEEPDPASPDDTRPLATRSVTVDGREVDLTNARWRQTAATDGSASFATRILDGAKPVLELTKTFTLKRRDAADGSRGFDVGVAQTFRKLVADPMTVVVSLNGPTAPTAENSRSEDRRFVAGFDEGDHVVKTDDTFVNELSKAKGTTKDLATGRPLPLLWVGTCNSYFDAIVRPDAAGTTGTPAVRIAAAPAVALDDTTHDAAFNLTTAAFTLPTGAAVPFDLHAFFGPKQRALLKNDYYAAYPRAYDETLVYISKYCGLLTFGWLISTLYGILYAFHWGLPRLGAGHHRPGRAGPQLPAPDHQAGAGQHDGHEQDGPGDRAAEEEVRRRQGGAEQGHDGRLQGAGDGAHPRLPADAAADADLAGAVGGAPEHLRDAPGRFPTVGPPAPDVDRRPEPARRPVHPSPPPCTC